MRGLGTLINVLASIAGGTTGILSRRFLQERHQETVLKAAGILLTKVPRRTRRHQTEASV